MNKITDNNFASSSSRSSSQIELSTFRVDGEPRTTISPADYLPFRLPLSPRAFACASRKAKYIVNMIM